MKVLLRSLMFQGLENHCSHYTRCFFVGGRRERDGGKEMHMKLT